MDSNTSHVLVSIKFDEPIQGAPAPEDCCVIVRVRVAKAEQSEVSHPCQALHSPNAQSASSTLPYFVSAAIIERHAEVKIANTIQKIKTRKGALVNGLGTESIFSRP
jgi:hypothetical protein